MVKNRLVYFMTMVAMFLPFVVSAQNSQFKNERRIYLWDVTLSMKGYQDRTPDIYDNVVTAITEDINSIIDEDTDIIVLPFQTSILDVWSAKATAAGRKELISKINGFNNEVATNTNIITPFRDVMMKYIDKDRRNVVVLMTDGVQNDAGTTQEQLMALIKKWCEFANQNDSYAFYVMLTEAAQNKELMDLIDETCRIYKRVIDDPEEKVDLNFIELMSQDALLYNIKEDAGKAMRLAINCKKRVEIPEDLEIEVECSDNPYIEIDQSAEVKNGAIEFEVKLKESYDELKNVLPTDENMRVNVHLEIDDPEDHPLVLLLNNNFTIELINKPEKTLKLYVKD